MNDSILVRDRARIAKIARDLKSGVESQALREERAILLLGLRGTCAHARVVETTATPLPGAPNPEDASLRFCLDCGDMEAAAPHVLSRAPIFYRLATAPIALAKTLTISELKHGLHQEGDFDTFDALVAMYM